MDWIEIGSQVDLKYSDPSIVTGNETEKIQQYLVAEEAGLAQVAHFLGEDVGVERLRLDVVAGGDGDIEDGHTRRVALFQVSPPGADIVGDVRVVAAGIGKAGHDAEGGHRWLRDEAVDIDVVLQRQLHDSVAGAAGVDLDGTPSIGDVDELRLRQVLLGDVHSALELRVGRGLDLDGQ